MELRRGRGATVRATGTPGAARVRELARELVEAGRRLGMSTDDLVALLREAR